MKIVQNAFFRSFPARFGQIAFLSVKVLKIVTLASNKKGKQLSMKIVQNARFVMRSTFWPNRIFEHQSSQNRHTGLKFSSKRQNPSLSMKIVQNALFRSFPARFGQIAFVRVFKIVTLPSNSLQTGKQCALLENCTKRSFQVMRSTFWPNRILERQSFKIAPLS